MKHKRGYSVKPRSPPEKHRFTRDGTSSCQSLGIRSIFFTSQRNSTCKVFPHPTEHLTHCWFEERPLYDAKYLHRRKVHEHVRRWRQDDRSTHPPNAHCWRSATGVILNSVAHGWVLAGPPTVHPCPQREAVGGPQTRFTRDTATRKSRFNTTPGLPTAKKHEPNEHPRKKHFPSRLIQHVFSRFANVSRREVLSQTAQRAAILPKTLFQGF